jgi:plastocyanin
MTALRLVALAAFLVLGSDVHAEDTVIEIANFTFNPPEVTVKPGTTVTWKNADDIPHLVVDDNTTFRSKALDTGETFSMTFANAGEIGYFCGLHPHMKGKIIVKP